MLLMLLIFSSATTVSITKLCKRLICETQYNNTVLCHYAERHLAERHFLFICNVECHYDSVITLNVILLIVIILNGIMLSVVMLSAIMPRNVVKIT